MGNCLGKFVGAITFFYFKLMSFLGSYQPSNELMLRFYGYFKQATQGPCKGARPAFWDVVGRAKYDAYKTLGTMSKQEAMKRYVDELHRFLFQLSSFNVTKNVFLELWKL